MPCHISPHFSFPTLFEKSADIEGYPAPGQLREHTVCTVSNITSGIDRLLAMSAGTRIQDLCAKASREEDPDELHRILTELREALHEYIEEMRTSIATEYPLLIARKVV